MTSLPPKPPPLNWNSISSLQDWIYWYEASVVVATTSDFPTSLISQAISLVSSFQERITLLRRLRRRYLLFILLHIANALFCLSCYYHWPNEPDSIIYVICFFASLFLLVFTLILYIRIRP